MKKTLIFGAGWIGMQFAEARWPRNLLTKLVEYRKVLRQPNSVTVVADFATTAYREIVDPTLRFEIISSAELQQRVLAPRSNCLLNIDKLHALGLALPPFHERLPSLLTAYARARH